MAMDDDRQAGSSRPVIGGEAKLDDETVRDLAMREALGLLDAEEEGLFEQVFEALTPDEQAAVLDLQAAVAREIGGVGLESPDRSLRYKVLARLTEEMALDHSATGPIAVIGNSGIDRVRSLVGSTRHQEAQVSELQFARVSRSAAVWRVASFALGGAAIALGALHFQGQSVSNQLLDQRASEIVAARFSGLLGEDVDLQPLLDSTTAVVTPLLSTSTSEDRGEGAGLLLRERDANQAGELPAALLCFQLPEGTAMVTVVAVPLDDPSAELTLGDFSVWGRTFAALPLELDGIDMANVRFEVRDADTGELILRSATVA